MEVNIYHARSAYQVGWRIQPIQVDICMETFMHACVYTWTSLVAQTLKNLPAMQETQVQSLEDPLEKGMATHSSSLAHVSKYTHILPPHIDTRTHTLTFSHTSIKILIYGFRNTHVKQPSTYVHVPLCSHTNPRPSRSVLYTDVDSHI